MGVKVSCPFTNVQIALYKLVGGGEYRFNRTQVIAPNLGITPLDDINTVIVYVPQSIEIVGENGIPSTAPLPKRDGIPVPEGYFHGYILHPGKYTIEYIDKSLNKNGGMETISRVVLGIPFDLRGTRVDI